MCLINKASNSIAYMCKNYYFQVLLREIGLLNAIPNTYQKVTDTLCNAVQQRSNTLDSYFGVKPYYEELNCFP